MNTAAIYARVSSDKQKEDQTISSQLAALMEFAQTQGTPVPSEWIFQDEGYSGSTLVRPGLESLRDLVAEGQIGTVLIYSPDRLSRKYAYQVLLMEEFSRHGTEVIFMKSPKATTPEESLLLQFQGMIAEYERAQIIERTRRGKKHRAKSGLVNVLSGAPYGYRYVKKTDHSSAFYEVIDQEAEVVREVYRLYTGEFYSIGAIVRTLNHQNIPTRKGKSVWERTTIWAMLKNPAYKGMACFGKTERCERQKVTRKLRQHGGFSKYAFSSRERARDQWIEIPVPAMIDEQTFALAQERLEQNKKFSLRRTKEPTLLQGLLVCSVCSYAYYRTSTETSKRKLYYYRCLGSDRWRYPNGAICKSHPIRQDYLDAIVWQKVIELIGNPELVRIEIERRMREIQQSNPTKIRQETLKRDLTRVQKGIDRLLDAYQEGLLPLDELRRRVPELRKKETTLKLDLQKLESSLVDQDKIQKLTASLEDFLKRLEESARSLDVKEQQRILRLVVKEVLVGQDIVTIRHSIPVSNSSEPLKTQSYILCKGRD